MTHQELNEICSDALADVISIGIDLSTNRYIFKLNNRLTRACGYCSYISDNCYEIDINPTYASIVDTDELYDTVVHELLHSAPDCMNHGKEWQRLADIANKHLLTNVSQYYSGNEYNPYKYGVRCCDCDRVIYRRTRQTATYKKIKEGKGKFHCNTCGGYNLIAIEL